MLNDVVGSEEYSAGGYVVAEVRSLVGIDEQKKREKGILFAIIEVAF